MFIIPIDSKGNKLPGYWRYDIRYYYSEKDLNAFDLHDVPGKRRNVIYLGTEEKDFK